MKLKLNFDTVDVNHLPLPKKDTCYYDDKAIGLALRIQPSGSRSWVMWETTGGKPRRLTLGSFPDMSATDARQAFYSRKSGIVQIAPTARHLRFGAILDRFWAVHAEHYRPDTQASMLSYFDTQLRPTFGATRIDKITPAMVAEWFYDYSKHSPGGANQALSHLGRVFSWATGNGIADRLIGNPVKSITRNRPKQRGISLSDVQKAQLFKVLSQVGGRSRQVADAILVIAMTGLRSGEVMRLQWSEVGKAHLNLKTSKTGPIRVPLHGAAREIIERQPRARGQVYVFASRKNPDQPLKSLDYVWYDIRSKARLPQGFRLHDLRHTYISTAIAQGETAYTAGALVGHKSVRSTHRYTHLDGTLLLPAAKSCATIIAQLLDGG